MTRARPCRRSSPPACEARRSRARLGYIRARENPDGGFALQPGGRSNAQSTAWAIQALLAAGGKPPAAAFRYLKKLQRADGSIRYSAQYATTPLWVSAQALPALMRRSFPLK